MYDCWFLNLGPPSKVSIAEANSDILGILRTEPHLLLGCEGVAKGPLPDATKLGYVKIRDRSTDARANIYAYIRADDVPTFKWEDMESTFDREPGRPGQHSPRSFVHFNFKRIQWLDAHHPPGWPGTTAARAEHLRKLRRVFAPWTDESRWEKLNARQKEAAKKRPRVLFWDRNMDMAHFRAFAKTCDAWVVGEKIDSMMYRGGVRIIDHGYTRKAGNHTVHTDHPWGAFRVRFKIARS